MKHVLRTAMRSKLPERIFNRQDKMGFPVPLHEWITQPGEVRDFVRDVFSSQAARSRELIDNSRVVKRMDGEARFGRQVWGLLSLELWQRAFHDRAHEYRRRLTQPMEEVTL
jgi:asparagine synthase (glutamine-hydrolysing)